jgi:hypothetical protein
LFEQQTCITYSRAMAWLGTASKRLLKRIAGRRLASKEPAAEAGSKPGAGSSSAEHQARWSAVTVLCCVVSAAACIACHAVALPFTLNWQASFQGIFWPQRSSTIYLQSASSINDNQAPPLSVAISNTRCQGLTSK